MNGFGRNKPRKKNGFTLIELLLVMAILALIAGLVAPNIIGKGKEARVKKAVADIDGGFAMALELFELDNGKFPEKLEDLITDPGNARRWKGPYLKKRLIQKDPWGYPYIYAYPGTNNPDGYDLYSSGPDDQEGTEDDISNWEEHNF